MYCCVSAPVDEMMRTNVEGVYAIGDVNGQQMLAHTAQHHGIIAVEHIAGLNPAGQKVTGRTEEEVLAAIVHHTTGTDDYGPEDSPAIVQAILRR